MGTRCKGVDGIKTLAVLRGSGAHSNERHVHMFQIACLELELSRRGKERQAAETRIRNVEARMAEIQLLIRKHSAAVAGMDGGTGSGTTADRAQGERLPATAAPPAADEGRGRRTLRY